jgi:hypothetical protein
VLRYSRSASSAASRAEAANVELRPQALGNAPRAFKHCNAFTASTIQAGAAVRDTRDLAAENYGTNDRLLRIGYPVVHGWGLPVRAALQ